MFLKASGESAPFVAFAGGPALLLGFLLRPTSGVSGSGPVVETGAIVAAALLGTAVLAAIVYGVVRVFMHAFDVAEWGARQRHLNDYRPNVVSATPRWRARSRAARGMSANPVPTSSNEAALPSDGGTRASSDNTA